MRGILAICREHGQPPSWWESLEEGDQALLIADMNWRRENLAKPPPKQPRGRGR